MIQQIILKELGDRYPKEPSAEDRVRKDLPDKPHNSPSRWWVTPKLEVGKTETVSRGRMRDLMVVEQLKHLETEPLLHQLLLLIRVEDNWHKLRLTSKSYLFIFCLLKYFRFVFQHPNPNPIHPHLEETSLNPLIALSLTLQTNLYKSDKPSSPCRVGKVDWLVQTKLADKKESLLERVIPRRFGNGRNP